MTTGHVRKVLSDSLDILSLGIKVGKHRSDLISVGHVGYSELSVKAVDYAEAVDVITHCRASNNEKLTFSVGVLLFD